MEFLKPRKPSQSKLARDIGQNFPTGRTEVAPVWFLSDSAKELSALSGLAPRIIESGSSVHSSYLSRRSSGRLRQILYLDSVPGVPKIPVLQEFHQRLIGKGKKKMTARCACMRKMLLILRSMVVHNTPFNDKFPNNQRKELDFWHTIFLLYFFKIPYIESNYSLDRIIFWCILL